MVGAQVVVLSTHSLFLEGIASRLKQHLPEQNVQVVDARQTDALARVIALQPTSVILDATDEEATRNCPLSQMLNALPSLTVIRLNPQKDTVQVVSSAQRVAEQVSDLIEVIQSIETAPSIPLDPKF